MQSPSSLTFGNLAMRMSELLMLVKWLAKMGLGYLFEVTNDALKTMILNIWFGPPEDCLVCAYPGFLPSRLLVAAVPKKEEDSFVVFKFFLRL